MTEREPVAWRKLIDGEYGFCDDMTDFPTHEDFGWEPLYTTPPQRKPLTDEQREEIAKKWRGRNWSLGDIIDAVEAAHDIKGDDTSPPQRPWVGLTDEEVASIYMNHTDRPMYEQWKFARAIEAKLKQKNGYAEEKNG